MIWPLKHEDVLDCVEIKTLHGSYQHLPLVLVTEFAPLKEPCPSGFGVAHLLHIDVDCVEGPLSSLVSVDIGSHALLLVAVDVLVICEQLALDMDGTSLHGFLDSVRDALHTVLTVDAVNVRIFQFFFKLALQGIVRQDAGLILWDVVEDLMMP